MSDLYQARNKVEQAANWRGSITVDMGGESTELTVRQLRDPEFFKVMSDIDMDEVRALQDDIPDDVMEEYKELDPDEDADRIEELEDQINDASLFEVLSESTFNGIMQAAKYGVEPDSDDVAYAQQQQAQELAQEYGTPVTEANARDHIQENVINPMIEDSTNFESFAIGMEVITQSTSAEGN